MHALLPSFAFASLMASVDQALCASQIPQLMRWAPLISFLRCAAAGPDPRGGRSVDAPGAIEIVHQICEVLLDGGGHSKCNKPT